MTLTHIGVFVAGLLVGFYVQWQLEEWLGARRQRKSIEAAKAQGARLDTQRGKTLDESLPPNPDPDATGHENDEPWMRR